MEVSSLHRYAIGQYVEGSGDVISHLNISHIRTDDGGLYKCIASNSMGSAEYSARLNVYGEYLNVIPHYLSLQPQPTTLNQTAHSIYVTYFYLTVSFISFLCYVNK